jgi:membrane protease YdiL (CAAX protease family)
VQAATATPRPAVWPVLAAYVVAFVLALIASGVFVLVAVLPRAGADAGRMADAAAKFAVSVPGLLGSASLTAAVLASVALVTARLAGKGVASRLRLGPTRATAAGVVAAVLGFAGLSIACSQVVDLLGVGRGGVMDVMGSVLRSSGPMREALAMLALGVAPGLAEEGFFRGLLQTRVAAAWGRWPAIVLSAAAFGLFHVDPVQGSVAFVAGLYLGWMADRFGGIRPTIAAHALNNAMFVFFATQAGDDDPAPRSQTLVLLVAGAVVWAASAAFLKSRWSVTGATRDA